MHVILDIFPIAGESQILNIWHDIEINLDPWNAHKDIYWTGIKVNIILGHQPLLSYLC